MSPHSAVDPFTELAWHPDLWYTGITMCGRFTLRTSGAALATLFDLPDAPQIAPRYNIAPTQPVAIVRQGPAGVREWTHVAWGLIPSWASDPSIGSRLINARGETAATKPSFRAAFKYRRCLVPADGFYEWQQQGGRKQPYYISRQDDGPFAFAGLWEHWQSRDGAQIDSCTLLTTEPNPLIATLHNRMPVILAPDDFTLWLESDHYGPEAVAPLLRPYAAAQMKAYPISTLVNNPRHEDPDCIKPLAV